MEVFEHFLVFLEAVLLGVQGIARYGAEQGFQPRVPVDIHGQHQGSLGRTTISQTRQTKRQVGDMVDGVEAKNHIVNGSCLKLLQRAGYEPNPRIIGWAEMREVLFVRRYQRIQGIHLVFVEDGKNARRPASCVQYSGRVG